MVLGETVKTNDAKLDIFVTDTDFIVDLQLLTAGSSIRLTCINKRT